MSTKLRTLTERILGVLVHRVGRLSRTTITMDQRVAQTADHTQRLLQLLALLEPPTAEQESIGQRLLTAFTALNARLATMESHMQSDSQKLAQLEDQLQAVRTVLDNVMEQGNKTETTVEQIHDLLSDAFLDEVADGAHG